jgi:hypothetical protein
MIPCYQLEQALTWMEKSVVIVTDADGLKTHHFDSWNADAFYFFDASGNIAEFIVRYDLQNDNQADFDISRVLCANEIGMPSQNIAKLNEHLNQEMKTDLWKGDLDRFGVHGDQEGLFLLPNYKIKEVWFPTRVKIQPEPFEAIMEADGKKYEVEYRNENNNHQRNFPLVRKKLLYLTNLKRKKLRKSKKM